MAKRYTRILAVLDDDTRRMVAERSVAIAEENNASLLLVYAIDLEPLKVGGSCYDSIGGRIKTILKMQMADLLEKARENESIPSCEMTVLFGCQSDMIVNVAAKDFHPDLVVCGSEKNSVSKPFSNDVSRSMVRCLECDVLVVK